VLTLRDVTGRVLHTSGLDLKGDDRVSLPHLSHQGMVVLTLSTPQGNRTVRYISK
jgi:hypothetical protein